MAAFSGFRKANYLFHWAMYTVLCYRTVTAIKTASKVGKILINVLFAVALVAAISSSPMAASRGI